MATAVHAEHELPPLTVVERVIVDCVKSQHGDHPQHALIALEDVAPALAELERLGFSVTAKEQGVVRLLSVQHPLMKLLRSEHGRALLEKLRNEPLACDRLERLMRFPQGQQLVEGLVLREDAAGVRALCAADAAAKLAVKFPHEPACDNFEVRSGLTFRLDEYLAHVRTMYLLATHQLSRPGE